MSEGPAPLVFERRTPMPVSAETLWAWHTRPGAFERLLPHWDGTRLVSATGGVADGTRVTLSIPAGPFRATWVARHEATDPPHSFRDVQESGPFARFEHTHRMESAGPARSCLVDRIEYVLPLGAAGRALGAGIAARRLAKMFAHRHDVTLDDLSRHAATNGVSPMRILVTGASGLVGSALLPFLSTGGHEIVRAVRAPSPRPGIGREVLWSPAEGRLDTSAEATGGPVDAIVHLAGENVGQRWSAAVKRAVMESRVQGTALVAKAAAAMVPKPRVLVCASAVGIYGDTGDREVDESAARGQGFLADVVEAWERAADPARDAGIRVVHLRFGVVLSPKGGALRKMLLPFKLGGGGVIGSGRQAFPWISIDDAVGTVHHALVKESLAGPVNAVAPERTDNHRYTKTLGKVLGRPTILPMPAFAARLAFGEMAQEMLLTGAHAVPKKLTASGYRWRHVSLEAALRDLLGK